MAGDLGAVEELCEVLRSAGTEKKEEESKKRPHEPMRDVDHASSSSGDSPELGPEQRLLQAGLTALAVICSSHEEFRKKVFDSGNHKAILEELKHPEARIRAAACQVVVSLARAEKFAKNVLVTEGAIPLLHKLLFDKYIDVELAATSALCNIALEFQTQVCAEGECVKRLVDLTQSKEAALRYRAMFAVKNLVFQTSSETKKSVMERLGYARLVALIDDEDATVGEQAICTLRNVLHERPEWIHEVIDRSGEGVLFKKIADKLESPNPALVTQSIYLLCNIASGGERQKALLMDSGTVGKAVAQLVHNIAVLYL